MIADSADHGANHGILIHLRRNKRKGLPNLNAAHACGDGPKLAPNFTGRFGLDVPHILMRRAAAKKDIDYRLLPAGLPVPRARLRPQDVCQRKGKTAEAESANL